MINIIKADRKSLKPFIIPSVILAIIGIIGGTYYFSVQHAKQAFLTEWQEFLKTEAQHGLMISYHSLIIEGWPWDLKLIINQPVVHSHSFAGWKATTEGAFTISSHTGQAYYPFFHMVTNKPVVVTFNLPEMPSVQIGSLEADINYLDPYHPTVHLKDTAFFNSDKTLHNPQAILNIKDIILEFKTMQASDQSSAHQAVMIKALTMAGPVIPFKAIQSAACRFALKGKLKAGALHEILEAWAMDDGTIDIESFNLQADNLTIQGQGSLSLDENLQPLAALTSQISGIEETIEDFSQRNIIMPTTARAYKAAYALAMMAMKRQDIKIPFESDNQHGTRNSLNFSLTVQNGKLSVGPMEILALPKINWQNIKFVYSNQN